MSPLTQVFSFRSSRLSTLADEYGFGEAPAAAGGGASLPCQYSNNSTESSEKAPSEKWNRTNSNHKKTAAALTWNVLALAAIYGIEKLGFLTLTFAEKVLDAREAQRRFNSLATHVLRSRYVEFMRVLERHKSGRIHYHLLIVLSCDIRTGLNFEEVAKCVYKSANQALRSEWAFWRLTPKKFGFGRTELLPVKSCADALATYVGKYISKHIEQREEADKGVRLVAYSKGAGRSNCRFSWTSPGAKNYRRKLEWLSLRLGYTPANYKEKFLEDFGSKWGFVLGFVVQQLKFSEYSTGAETLSDWPNEEGFVPLDAVDVKLGSFAEARAKESQTTALTVLALHRLTPQSISDLALHHKTKVDETECVSNDFRASKQAFGKANNEKANIPSGLGGQLERGRGRVGGWRNDARSSLGRSDSEADCATADSGGDDSRGGASSRNTINETTNPPSQWPIRREHCQGGDFCPEDATDSLADWDRVSAKRQGKNTTFTSGP